MTTAEARALGIRWATDRVSTQTGRTWGAFLLDDALGAVSELEEPMRTKLAHIICDAAREHWIAFTRKGV